MNAKRRSKHRGPRNVDSNEVVPSVRGLGRRWIVLSASFLVLVLLGIFLWPREPMKPQEPAPSLGLNPSGDSPARTKPDAFNGSQDVPLPPLFSPNAPQEECKLETLRMATRLAEAFPDQLDALQTSATIHWAMGDVLEAVRLWEKCLTMDSQFSPASEGLGRVSLSQGDFERAIDMLQKAIELEPQKRPLVLLLAKALVRANRMEEAVTVLTKLRQLGLTPPAVSLLLGQAYLELEQYDDARRLLEIALEKIPNERQVHFALAKVYDRLGKQDKAKWHRDKVTQLVDVYRKAGRGQVRASGSQDTLLSDAVQAHRDAAATYYWHGNVDESILLCRKAAALDPKDVESRKSLAALYEQTGRTRQALRIRQELRDLSTASPKNARSTLRKTP